MMTEITAKNMSVLAELFSKKSEMLELNKVLNSINNAAKTGLKQIYFKLKYDSTIKELKTRGFKVENSGRCVSW